MSDPTPDQVTAYLAEVREAVRQRDELLPRMPVDVSEFNAAQDRLAEPAPRLLAAIEAVRALTSEWDIAAARLAGEVEHVSPRNQGARVLLEVRSELRLIQARAVREAISRALLGGEPGATP